MHTMFQHVFFSPNHLFIITFQLTLNFCKLSLVIKCSGLLSLNIIVHYQSEVMFFVIFILISLKINDVKQFLCIQCLGGGHTRRQRSGPTPGFEFRSHTWQAWETYGMPGFVLGLLRARQRQTPLLCYFPGPSHCDFDRDHIKSTYYFEFDANFTLWYLLILYKGICNWG